jgi:hypothetical protein
MKAFQSLVILAALAIPVALTPVAISATAITAGNPVPGGSSIDTCPGCDYIVGQAFMAAGYTVSTFTFTSGQAGDITPLLFTRSNSGGNATFTLVGIGTLETTTGSGTYTFNFGLTSGVDTTTTDTYFGFFSNTPVVLFDTFNASNPPPNANGGVFFAAPPVPTLGTTTTSDYASGFHDSQLGFNNDRDYAILATADSPVSPAPEPSAVLLVGTGFLGLVGAARRKFQA